MQSSLELGIVATESARGSAFEYSTFVPLWVSHADFGFVDVASIGTDVYGRCVSGLRQGGVGVASERFWGFNR